MTELAFVAALRDRYTIESEIGHGGMGRVFVARDLKLDRAVAIKFLHSGDHGDEELRRFEQEARAAGSLEHPNVLVVHDIGVSEDGPYIVSELLQGATLGDRMHEKALRLGKVVDYALQLAQGLRAAHAKGIVHRDLKPENLFITHEGRLKILDFGIAKLAKRKDTPKRTTEDGSLLGTVAYMSPEQVRGRRADPRSDIFAFGTILYEMLCGRRAFQGGSSMEIGAAILRGDSRDLPPHVPKDLQRIVWRCLEQDPNDRFQSAADLAVELGGQAGMRPRNLGRTAYVAFAALAIFALFQMKDRWRPQADIERSSIAVLPFVNLSGDKDNEYFSDGITEELINALANVEGLRVASRTSSFSFKGQNLSASHVGQQLRVAALVEGSVRRDRNNLRVVVQLIDVTNGFHLWSRTYDREWKNVLAVEDELAHSIAQALRPSLAGTKKPLLRPTTSSPEAHDLYLRARYFWNDRTEPGLRRAIALYQQAIETDPAYALAHAGLSDSYFLIRNYARKADRGDWLPKAKLHAEKALEADETLAEAHASLASVAEANYEWTTAVREFRRAIDLKPDYPRAHHWYGRLLRDLGRFTESDAEVERALQLEPGSVPILIVSASGPYFKRNYDQAVERLTRLLEIAADQPIVPLLLAATYVQKRRFADAIGLVDKFVQPSDRESGWLSWRGYVHAKSGDREEALRVLAELERRVQREYVSPGVIALVHAGLGDRDRALALLDQGYAVRDGTLTSLKVDPVWDALRSDPRFRQLLTRMHLD